MAKGQYIHEQVLMDAYKKLYMLGNRPYRPKKGQGGEALGEGIGQAMVGLASRKGKSRESEDEWMRREKARAALLRQQEAADADQEISDVAFIKGGQKELDIVEGRAVPDSVYDPSTSLRNNRALYDRTMATIDKNEAAGGARIGGYFTKSGLEENMKEAQNIGHDKVLLKGMMGTAGQLVSPPPDHMRNYRR